MCDPTTHAATPTLCLALTFRVLQVTVETEEMRFNTALAAMMEFINAVSKTMLQSCDGVHITYKR